MIHKITTGHKGHLDTKCILKFETRVGHPGGNTGVDDIIFKGAIGQDAGVG